MNLFQQWAEKLGLQPAAAARAPALPAPLPVLNSPAAPPAPVASFQAKEPTPMPDNITQDLTNAAEAAGGAVLKTVEAGAGTVISKIASGAVKVWNEAEALIDADVAKIKSALPASALPGFDAVVSDVKQGASDTLTLASGALSAAAPTFTKGLEGLADTAMATVSNGEALPLVPLVNSGIDELVNLGVAALQAWGLQQKAALAKAA